MKKINKFILVLPTILLIVISVMLLIDIFQDKVTPKIAEKYATDYIHSYKELVNRLVPEDERHKYLLYDKYPNIILISQDESVAIIFFNEEQKPITKSIKKRAEIGVLNEHGIILRDENKLHVTINNNVRNSYFHNARFIDTWVNNNENSTMYVADLYFNDVYINPFYLKGSLYKFDYEKKNALEDSKAFFALEAGSNILTSDEFKEYNAYPELRAILTKINENIKNGLYKDNPYYFQIDYRNFYNKAKELNVTREYADNLKEFFDNQNDLSELNKKDYFNISFQIILFILSIVVNIVVTIRLNRK